MEKFLIPKASNFASVVPPINFVALILLHAHDKRRLAFQTKAWHYKADCSPNCVPSVGKWPIVGMDIFNEIWRDCPPGLALIYFDWSKLHLMTSPTLRRLQWRWHVGLGNLAWETVVKGFRLWINTSVGSCYLECTSLGMVWTDSF